MPPDLPISALRPRIAEALRSGSRLVLSAPTGSGKSTQVPRYILEDTLGGASAGRVVVLQPRRIAARMLAARVAAECGTPPGTLVGYRTRFESCVSKDSRIVYETEGILLRQLVSDPRLPSVDAVVFDEFHERHVYGDVTLAKILELQQSRRPDLKIVVMSATLDAPLLQSFLAPCAFLSSEGRTFPVDISYLDRPLDPVRTPVWTAAAHALADLWPRTRGNALVFMPGAWEISRTLDALRALPAFRGVPLLPLHGELPPDVQDSAVRPDPAVRRVIVATNVAETSLTIPDVRVVVDSGLARIARFDPFRGIDTLMVESISRASADQRAGRAGRTAPGLALRLWTRTEHAARPAADVPEILRTDPAEILLLLASQGMADPAAFPWLQPPAPRALARAMDLLRDLGALAPDGAVTALGRQMLSFPLHPRYSRMLLEARAFSAVRPVALLAAMAQSRPFLLRNPERSVRDARADLLSAWPSDPQLAVRVYLDVADARFDPRRCERLGVAPAAARAVWPVYQRFLGIARSQGLPVSDDLPSDEAFARCILAGFSDRVARRIDVGSLRCELARGRRGELARESVATVSPLLVATEIREIGHGNGESQVLVTQATPLRPEWLRECFPGDFEDGKVTAFWNQAAKRVEARAESLFRGLAVESKAVAPPPDAAAALLAAAVEDGTCVLKNWNADVDRWIARVNWLARTRPDLQLPPYNLEARHDIVAQLCYGHASAKDIREIPVLPAVRSWLDAAQQALVDRFAPETAVLSNGRKIKIRYDGVNPPFAAIRIQELFGVQGVPAIAGGRVPLVLHILAPNQRPVQITSDLPAFWRDHYPRVKSELARKYPKHEWR